MAGIRLYQLPDSQLLRIKKMYNTCARMQDLLISYYDKEEISYECVKVNTFDVDLAIKYLEQVEKIFLRIRKNFEVPQKNSSQPEKNEKMSSELDVK